MSQQEFNFRLYRRVTIKQAAAINELCATINDWAQKKQWNDNPLRDFLQTVNAPKELIARLEQLEKMSAAALFGTEISEMVEGLRRKEQPAMDDHVPELTSIEAELADLLIRIFHFAGQQNINLGYALTKKHAYNTTRPPKHGKSA